MDHPADARRARRRQDRAGAERVRGIARREPGACVALIGESGHETRDVMVEGVSGLLAVHPHVKGRSRSRRGGGSPGRTGRSRNFLGEDPETCAARVSAAWCEELSKWRQAEATFDMLQFGLRLGERPR